MTLPPDGAFVEVRWTAHRPRRSLLTYLPLAVQMWLMDHVLWKRKIYSRTGTLRTKEVVIPEMHFTAVFINDHIVTTITPDNVGGVEVSELAEVTDL